MSDTRFSASNFQRVRDPIHAAFVFLAIFAVRGSGAAETSDVKGRLAFNEHIQPILAENCYQCHGPDPGSRKAGLRLDRRESAYAPGKDRGPAIVPGDTEKSALVQRIESEDEDERMPPLEAHKTLKPAEIALLRQWVKEGAEYQEHWAFIAPVRPKVPAGTAVAGARSAVDAFILERLAKAGLKPSPEADRSSLLRRVTFDLTGLPPTPGEVAAFAADTAPNAYERAVDRLLASPHYGEHRARYWLDYIRYADTHGLHFDNLRSIWPYRDYVIRAFNANKPFDRFVREQLAGDLMPAKSIEEIVATGFMRCNLTTNEGGTIPEEVFVNQTRDRVESFGVTFLGLTTGCAACHDHKFDPITQKDFYGLAAFLGNTAEKAWDLNVADPDPVIWLPDAKSRAAMDGAVAWRGRLQARLDDLRRTADGRFAAWLAAGNKLHSVSDDQLELRLRLDEGKGDVVANSAPNAGVASFKADTNPLVWGENALFWPSMRMDIASQLPLGQVGTVDGSQAFSGGGWVLRRQKVGGGSTGSGALISRMRETGSKQTQGWELYQNDQRLTLTLSHGEGEKSIEVTTMERVIAFDWAHVFFTYDGSGRAAGVRIYVNGKPVAMEIRRDSLAGASIATQATTQLGRRDDGEPLRETSFQDVRIYRRELTPDEVTRLPLETVAAEIVARSPDMSTWTPEEKDMLVDRFFEGTIDTEAMETASEIALLDDAIGQYGKDGVPTLIAREKPTPGSSDILKRGDYYARMGRVPPLTPHFLPPLAAGERDDRAGLADWLLTDEQPLFARVTVNRMWQEIFGTGLVDTPGDFGVMGSKPSHPELLDWLAVEFRESGWDVKRMYRLLVASATYRQTSRVTPEQLLKDPANRLLSRGPRFRMDGEILRDAALATSGLLVDKLGGPPVKPYQPPGVWEEVAMPESNTKSYVDDQGAGLYRRSLYSFWKRASPPPSMETFDAPSRETVCVRRARSNTPLQAFVTMNDTQWVEAARTMAGRAMHAQTGAEARIDMLAMLTLGRRLDAGERAVIAKSLDGFMRYFRESKGASGEFLAVGESVADSGLDPVELASWTMVASQFYNLDEFLTK